MELSIIIVNWNSADYLRQCLRSISDTINDIGYEVIVIDNASYDGAAAMIDKEFPSAKFLQSETNLGFARANNQAFKVSSGHAVLFLNPDTEVLDGSIVTLHRQLYKLTDAGAVGGTLLNSDGTVQTSCIQAFPTVANQLLDLELLRKRFPKLQLWGIQGLHADHAEPVAVEVISGACLMVLRSVFEDVGMFSDEYFMYTEDIDLCYKIRSAGYHAYFVKEAKVIHHGGKSSGQPKANFTSDVLMRDSVSRFMRKSQGPVAERLYKLAMTMAALTRLTAVTGLTLVGKHSADLSAIREKWKKILAWSLGSNHGIPTLSESSLQKARVLAATKQTK